MGRKEFFWGIFKLKNIHIHGENAIIFKVNYIDIHIGKLGQNISFLTHFSVM